MTSFSTLYDRALRLLSRRNHSRYELRRKLSRKGPSGVLDHVLDHLESRGYIDDQTFAYERALRQRRSKYWGSRRISQDLRSLGISARIILEVLEQVEREWTEARSLKDAVQFWIERFGPPQTGLSTQKALRSLHASRARFPDRTRGIETIL